MKGILRPCRHHLTREARDRWRAHLCGTCLSLRDTAGQAARALTGYDLLLIPVLIEAQQGQLPTVRAGACALRGMRRADVVDPSSAAARAGAAAMLAAGSGGLCDKLGDGEVPVALRPAAHAAARWFADAARRAAGDAGGDVAPLLEAATRAADVEARPAATLDELLEPAGSAVATAFGQTAAAAGTPTNEAALRRLGDAFGRLVHLLDAVDDRDRDRRQGRFNPLDATGTDHAAAGALARRLRSRIADALRELQLRDGELLEALLGPTLDAAVARRWPSARPVAACSATEHRPRPVGSLVGLVAAATLAVWGGGPWGGDPWGGRRPPRRRGYGGRRGWGPGGPYGDYGGYGYGYGRPRRGFGGPSCCDMLACDCCLNEACNGCCGGQGGDCCVCCI